MKQYLVFIVILGALLFGHGCERAEQPETVYSTPACYDPLFQRDETCDFRGIRWGMSQEEVKAAEGRQPDDEGIHPELGNYALRYDDVSFDNYPDVTLRYFFLNEKCFMGVYYFYAAEFSGYEELLVRLTALYGESTYSNEANDHTLGWQTKNTHIFIAYYFDKDSQLVVTLDYISKDYSPEEWRTWSN